MSGDYRTERIDPTFRVRDHAGGHDGTPHRHLPSHAYEAAARSKPRFEAADVASVLGLPAKAVTPELLAAVTPLLAEIDRLHALAEQAEHRARWQERQGDRHSVVPCLTRRAFVRELDSFLAGGDASGTLGLIQVAGVEALRQIHGLTAGEGALRHVGAVVLGALRSTDMVGCLGGSDFAILLPGTPEEWARVKFETICERITEPSFSWMGERVALRPSFGLYVLSPGDSAEGAIAAADRQRRGAA